MTVNLCKPKLTATTDVPTKCNFSYCRKLRANSNVFMAQNHLKKESAALWGKLTAMAILSKPQRQRGFH